MSISTVLYDNVHTVSTASTVYWNKGKDYLTISGCKEIAIQLNVVKGTAIAGTFSIQLSCDGVNWADFKVGGTLVSEAVTDSGSFIISLETPCLHIKPKFVVSSITDDATVQFYVNAKD